MQTLVLLTISVLAWIWFLVPRDRQPFKLAGRILAVGAIGGSLSVLCAWGSNEIAAAWLKSRGAGSLSALLIFWAWVGLGEESSKAFWSALLARRVRKFSEPLDGVLHASAVALGFASYENLMYMSGYGDLIVIPRSLTAVPLHLTLSTIWGLALTRARILNRSLFTAMLPSVLFSAALHGGYDFMVQIGSEWGGAAVPLLLLAIAILTFRQISRRLIELKAQSPQIRAGTCLRCGTVNPIGSQFCGRCGTSLEREFYAVCPACGARTEKSARFCPLCSRELD